MACRRPAGVQCITLTAGVFAGNAPAAPAPAAAGIAPPHTVGLTPGNRRPSFAEVARKPASTNTGTLFAYGFGALKPTAGGGFALLATPLPTVSAPSGILCAARGCNQVCKNAGAMQNHIRAAHSHLGTNQSFMETSFPAAGSGLTVAEQSARHKKNVDKARAEKDAAKEAEQALLANQAAEVCPPFS
jgi:hypothetical protein